MLDSLAASLNNLPFSTSIIFKSLTMSSILTHTFHPSTLTDTVLLLLIAYSISIYLYNHISHVPGPAISRISNLWKIHAAFRGEFPKRNIALHRKYGSLVRTGPNSISVDDPAALPIIYGFKQVFDKVTLNGRYPSRILLTRIRPTSMVQRKPGIKARHWKRSLPLVTSLITPSFCAYLVMPTL